MAGLGANNSTFAHPLKSSLSSYHLNSIPLILRQALQLKKIQDITFSAVMHNYTRSNESRIHFSLGTKIESLLVNAFD